MSECSAPELREACQDLQKERFDKQGEWNKRMDTEMVRVWIKLDSLTWNIAIIVGVGVAINTAVVAFAAFLGIHK